MAPKPKTPNNDSTRYRDAFLIPGIFYLEVTAAVLFVIVLSGFLARFFSLSEFFVSFLVISIVVLGLLQVGAKVKRNVRERGLPPSGVAIVFAGTLLAPGLLVFFLLNLRSVGELPESKAAMFAVYEAEKEFMKSFRTYSLSIKEIGFVPRAGKRAYAVGFASACALKFGLEPERAMAVPEGSAWVESKRVELLDFFRSVRGPTDCMDPKEGFEAFAAGPARENGPLEYWRIDENKRLEKFQPRR